MKGILWRFEQRYLCTGSYFATLVVESLIARAGSISYEEIKVYTKNVVECVVLHKSKCLPT